MLSDITPASICNLNEGGRGETEDTACICTKAVPSITLSKTRGLEENAEENEGYG